MANFRRGIEAAREDAYLRRIDEMFDGAGLQGAACCVVADADEAEQFRKHLRSTGRNRKIWISTCHESIVIGGQTLNLVWLYDRGKCEWGGGIQSTARTLSDLTDLL